MFLAAPGLPKALDAHDTATPITLHLQRAKPLEVGTLDLPDPLADPVLNLRAMSATAKTHFVKPGNCIQIIDVEGRQRTDFQCFDARRLDRGIQQALDVTAARTLMGHAYSMPGLYSKYFDQD